jgi:hypothetical protein
VKAGGGRTRQNEAGGARSGGEKRTKESGARAEGAGGEESGEMRWEEREKRSRRFALYRRPRQLEPGVDHTGAI